MAPAVSTDHGPATGVVSAYDWYVVAILFSVSVLGYIDRVILSFLVEAIKADLRLNDAELGAVTGMAFAVLYVFGGVFIGRMLDGGRRVMILTGCILVWSVATAASGFAMGFASLFLARMFVGVGEAGLNPAAIGIISSRFPQHQVQKPIGLFTTGLYVGGGLAMMVGARLLAQFTATVQYQLPLIGDAEPWRAVFLLLAVPGIVIALLVKFTVKDDRGGGAMRGAVPVPKGEAMAFTRRNAKLIALLAGSVIAWSLNNYGLLNWYPAMLMRSYGMTPGGVATTYGPAFLFAGVAGCLAVYPYHAWLARRFAPAKSAFYLCFSLMAVLSVTTLVGPLVPTIGAAIVMAYANMFVSSMSVASVFVLIVAVAPAGLRGLYTGFYMALVNLTGGAFGSVLVGLMTDHVFGANGLNLALAVMALAFGPLGALLMYLASREDVA
ncbi:hypothetical protein AWL63_04280 [Sphingomonas panacis]|uniref:Major facilitator superfamily (MFS) profile domain-containing protein n=2 Tax=Sphingomonas panacis TaxID=1560345 RepID=A0A1B3Z799_9SPHN|nr:hypothetical protein AWL63_04280 [Sphingomonas panacis]